MSRTELVFLHIPKTAGTSQHQIFNRHYGKRAVFWMGEDCPADTASFSRSGARGAAIIGGHQPLSFYPKKLDPLYCAVLRDPVERAISLYCYYTRPDLARQPGGREARESARQYSRRRGIDPDSMLRSLKRSRLFRREIANAQCGYLSRGRATLAGVRDTLARHDMVIGTVSAYRAFQQVLASELGWPVIAMGHANQSRANYLEEFLADRELVAMIRDLTGEDTRLLDFVSQQPDGVLVNTANPDSRRERLRAMPRRSVVVTEDEARDNRLWRFGQDNALPWPEKHIIHLPANRVLFMPIPGAGSNIVVDFLTEVAAPPLREHLPRRGLLPWVSNFNLGVMLKDLPETQARARLGAAGCRRLALLRDPLERLADVYLEFIVRHPRRLRGQTRFLESLARVQRSERPDLQGGMTFREYIDNICDTAPEHLGLARAPQALFLAPLLPDCTLYREDQLPQLLEDAGLGEWAGSKRVLDWQDRVAAREPIVPNGRLTDATPETLRQREHILPSDLFDTGLEQRAREYFARDFALLDETGEAATERWRQAHGA